MTASVRAAITYCKTWTTPSKSGVDAMRAEIRDAKRIVFKIGTSTLVDERGTLDGPVLHQLVALWSTLRKAGKDILLVSSGAVAMGWADLGLRERPRRIPEKQAAAAVGQCKLMTLYDSFFRAAAIQVAQVLLTRDDLNDRKRYLNARNTLTTLLHHGLIPIINENDTVAYEEIKFGENDTLASMVAGLVDADLVCILSDVPGLFTADPRKDGAATLIPLIEEFTPEIQDLAGGATSTTGSGGMKTKVEAAKIAAQSGIPLLITGGKDVETLRRILDGGEGGSLFAVSGHALGHRKRWIAYGSALDGAVVVDDGAVHALLQHGKSLLPVGILAVEGAFSQGSVIAVKTRQGREIARGIVNYGYQEVQIIKGCHSHEIAALLGEEVEEYDEIIHRDNLVLEESGV